MGASGNAPNAGNAVARNYRQYARYLPGLLNATIGGQGSADVGAAQSAANITPMYSQTGLNNLTNFAPQYAGIGSYINNLIAQGNAQTSANTIAGAGGQAAQNAMDLQQRLNPGYYAARDAVGNQATNLVNSINLNGLSGGEQAAVERSLAQS